MGEFIASNSLEVAGLTPLMRVTPGISKIAIGLIDGPVAANHSDLATENIRSLTAATGPATPNNGVALSHGTFVAGILMARRGSRAPAICPGCTLLVRPIFLETASDNAEMPSATPNETAEAIAECVDARAGN
jgi:subtilisin family serine protease